MKKIIFLLSSFILICSGNLYALNDFESHEYAAINQSYFTNLMRFCMTEFKEPGYMFLDHSFSMRPTVSASCIAETPIIKGDENSFALLFGFQTYLFSEDIFGFNFMGGTSIIIPSLRSKIYAGGYWALGEEYVTDEYTERYIETGEMENTTWDQMHPFFYMINPWSDTIKTRGDITYTGNELTKWGVAALLDVLGFKTETAYDSVKIFKGKETNSSLVGWKIPVEYKDSTPAYVPHMMIRVGVINHMVDDGGYHYENSLGDVISDSSWKNRYCIAEYKPDVDGWRGYHAGLSYSEKDGKGLMIGFGGGDKDLRGIFNIQYNYLMINTYGARTEKYAYTFQMIWTVR